MARYTGHIATLQISGQADLAQGRSQVAKAPRTLAELGQRTHATPTCQGFLLRGSWLCC